MAKENTFPNLEEDCEGYPLKECFDENDFDRVIQALVRVSSTMRAFARLDVAFLVELHGEIIRGTVDINDPDIQSMIRAYVELLPCIKSTGTAVRMVLASGSTVEN